MIHSTEGTEAVNEGTYTGRGDLWKNSPRTARYRSYSSLCEFGGFLGCRVVLIFLNDIFVVFLRSSLAARYPKSLYLIFLGISSPSLGLYG